MSFSALGAASIVGHLSPQWFRKRAQLELIPSGGDLPRVDPGLKVDSKEGTAEFPVWRWPAQSSVDTGLRLEVACRMLALGIEVALEEGTDCAHLPWGWPA